LIADVRLRRRRGRHVRPSRRASPSARQRTRIESHRGTSRRPDLSSSRWLSIAGRRASHARRSSTRMMVFRPYLAATSSPFLIAAYKLVRPIRAASHASDTVTASCSMNHFATVGRGRAGGRARVPASNGANNLQTGLLHHAKLGDRSMCCCLTALFSPAVTLHIDLTTWSRSRWVRRPAQNIDGRNPETGRGYQFCSVRYAAATARSPRRKRAPTLARTLFPLLRAGVRARSVQEA